MIPGSKKICVCACVWGGLNTANLYEFWYLTGWSQFYAGKEKMISFQSLPQIIGQSVSSLYVCGASLVLTCLVMFDFSLFIAFVWYALYAQFKFIKTNNAARRTIFLPIE